MPIPNKMILELVELLEKHGCSWDDLRSHFAPTVPATPSFTAVANPDKSDIDAKFVEQAIKSIINSYDNGNCKLSRAAKEFLLSLRERAGQYKSVRFSPKQWSWFNSIMADAGVEALEYTGEMPS